MPCIGLVMATCMQHYAQWQTTMWFGNAHVHKNYGVPEGTHFFEWRGNSNGLDRRYTLRHDNISTSTSSWLSAIAIASFRIVIIKNCQIGKFLVHSDLRQTLKSIILGSSLKYNTQYNTQYHAHLESGRRPFCKLHTPLHL